MSKQTLLALGLASSAMGVRIVRTSNSGRDCYSMYDGKALLRVAPCTTTELDVVTDFFEQQHGKLCKVLSDNLDLPTDGSCADIPVVCDEDGSADAVKSFGHIIEVASRDAGAFYRNQSGVARGLPAASVMSMSSDLFWSDWRNLDAQLDRVEAAVAASGGIASLETAGQTYEGRPIKLVRLRGAGWSPGKPRNVFTFNVHAREWITGMAGVYAVEKLIDIVKKDPSYIDGMEVVMVPMANPDGFLHTTTEDRFHRKNMNREVGKDCLGIDLNRNFDIGWGGPGSSSFCWSDQYRGTSAASEPETKVLASILEEAPTTVYIDVHSYTNLVLSSWGYTTKEHPRAAEFRALGLAMTKAIEKRHGTSFREGPTSQVLYKASGTTTDYGTKLGALGYCYELRPGRMQGLRGFAPPVSDVLPAAEECFEGLLVAISRSRLI